LYSIVKGFIVIPKIVKADSITIMPEGGFGHTVTAPDILRRLYPKKNNIFVIFSECGRHNRKISLMWKDVRIVFFPLNFGIRLRGIARAFPVSDWYKSNIHRLFLKYTRFLNKKAKINYMLDMYKIILHKDNSVLPESLNGAGYEITCRWVIGYFNLMKNDSSGRVFLPENNCKKIRKKIKDFLAKNGIENHKLCCLYLRQKNKDAHDITSSSRAGSDLMDYVPAIEFLNSQGYQVLLTGDVEVDDKFINKFGGKLIDYKVIHVDRDFFYLFAATEADIFVGDSGGGVWLSGVNRIPRLILNAFPFGYGQPYSWIYYKTLRDSQGELIEVEKLLSEHLYKYVFENATLESNSAQEIDSAVRQFIVDLEHPYSIEKDNLPVSNLSNYAWIKQSGAKLSPVYMEQYSQKSKKRNFCVKNG